VHQDFASSKTCG
jgi:hypothetical protein